MHSPGSQQLLWVVSHLVSVKEIVLELWVPVLFIHFVNMSTSVRYGLRKRKSTQVIRKIVDGLLSLCPWPKGSRTFRVW